MKRITLILSMLAIMLASCKKDTPKPEPGPEPKVVKYCVKIDGEDGGTYTIKCGDKAVSDGDMLEENSVLNIEVTADEGYRSGLNVVSPVTLTSDTTIRVRFAPAGAYFVKSASVEGGSIAMLSGGKQLKSGDWVLKSKYVVCEIVADNNHFLEKVNVYKGRAVRDSFRITKDTVVVPEFSDVKMDVASQSFRICNYNIRYYNGGQSGDDTGAKAWPARMDKVFEMIRKHSMDVCGIEEITVKQAPNFISSMPEYEYIGYGRDNGKEYSNGGTGEETGLIYKKSKFVKLNQGRLFLSSTPNKPSKVSGASFNRMVTWVKLKERATDKIIIFCATHFDHPTSEKGIKTRSTEADIALNLVPQIAGGYPLFFVGDFNCRPDEPAYEKLSNVWKDSFITMGSDAQGGYVCNAEQLAKPDLEADCACKGNTYTGLYSASDVLPKRIDYVLYDEAFAEPIYYLADNDNLGYVTLPSDHVPVITEMKLK